jgi:hypothetical protein
MSSTGRAERYRTLCVVHRPVRASSVAGVRGRDAPASAAPAPLTGPSLVTRGLLGTQQACCASLAWFAVNQSQVHSAEPVAVGRETADEPVQFQVLPGKLSLPCVGRRLASREMLVAPGEDGTVESAPRGEFHSASLGSVFPAPLA